MTWSKDWPTKAGWYWFWGVRSSYASDPHLMVVQVHIAKGDRDFPIYIAEGGGLYKKEGAKGVWQRAEIPEPPQASKIPSTSMPLSDKEMVDEITQRMSGKEWDADTLDDVASILRAGSRRVKDVTPE